MIDNNKMGVVLSQAMLDINMANFVLNEISKIQDKNNEELMAEVLEVKSQMYLMRNELDNLRESVKPLVYKNYKKYGKSIC